MPGSRTILSPDGLWCASNFSSSSIASFSIVLKNSVSGLLQHTLTGHRDWVRAVDFSPDSSRLASSAWDRQLFLWDVASGERIAAVKPYSDEVDSVCFSPGGELLAVGSSDRDQYLELWNGRTLEHVDSLRGHVDTVTSIAFSPDGKRLASASFDHTVKLWDVSRRMLLATLVPRTDGVRVVAFSPDGTTLATGGGGAKVTLLWHVDDLLPPATQEALAK